MSARDWAILSGLCFVFVSFGCTLIVGMLNYTCGAGL